MASTPNKLYLLIITASVAGYVWLYINMHQVAGIHAGNIDACFMKQTLHIPCPSCGSTRSVAALFSGNIKDALYWNPLGIIVAFIMVLGPLWAMADLLLSKATLFSFYKIAENTLSKKKYAIPAIVLILINWAWNIHKNL